MTPDQIISALKAGEAGRELDFYFWLAIKGLREHVEGDEVYIVHPDGLKEHIGFQDPTENRRNLNFKTWFSATLPKLTTSLDACKRLQEEVLPDAEIDAITLYDVARVTIYTDAGSFGGDCETGGGIPKLCAAFCIAILQALGGDHE